VIPDSKRLRDAALSLRGKRVLVAGLGVFGGGAAAARYLADQGADVTVTDLKSEEDLADSVRLLEGRDIALKLGRHDSADFESSDLVVANPAIPFRSRFLQAAQEADVPITTEMGLFAARFTVLAGRACRHPRPSRQGHSGPGRGGAEALAPEASV